MAIEKLAQTACRRLRIALILIGLFALQSALRLIGLSPPFQRLTLQVPMVHALDLAAFALLALLLLRMAHGRKIVQIPLALMLSAVWILLIVFDAGLLLAIRFHQSIQPLATVPIFYCNAETIMGCVRPFPGITLLFITVWIALSVLIFFAANGLAKCAQQLFKSRLRFILVGFLMLWGSVWLFAFGQVYIREPLIRFFGKSPPGAQPRALMSVPRPNYKIAPTAEAKPRLLILIAIDSLRADAVELAPDKPSRTPFLQSLSASGALHNYGPAVAVCPTSYCGITGLLSSSDWATLQRGPPLTLPDVLAANGYTSHYLLGGPHRNVMNLAKLYGPNVDTMLDDSSPDSSGLIDDREQVKRLKSLKLVKPSHSFVFIHLMSAHAAGLRFDNAANNATSQSALFSSARYTGAYVDFYNQGVTQADLILRQLFDVLKQRKILDDALIIITADHGERLTGATGHGGEVDLSTALIPMLIYDTRTANWPVIKSRIASQFDAAPTLLVSAGIDVPLQWQGKPLQSAALRPAAPTDSEGHSALVGQLDGQWIMLRCNLKNAKLQMFPKEAAEKADILAMYRKWSNGLALRTDANPCISPSLKLRGAASN